MFLVLAVVFVLVMAYFSFIVVSQSIEQRQIQKEMAAEYSAWAKAKRESLNS